MANNIIAQLRSKHGMSQEELAEKVFVTRQAVSRWENGETTPNPETIKLLELFDVSINTLLGSPRKLICRCCGMPKEGDSLLGHDKNGTINENYCKWCYADGTFTYGNMDDIIDVCAKNMANEHFTEEQARTKIHALQNAFCQSAPKYNGGNENGSFLSARKPKIQLPRVRSNN